MHEAVPLPNSPRLRGWALLSQTPARVPGTPTLSRLVCSLWPVSGCGPAWPCSPICSSRGALPLGPPSSKLHAPPTTTYSHVHLPLARPPEQQEPTDRLPEGQEDLAAQHVEEVAGRGAVDHHPVAVVELTYVKVGLLEVLRGGRELRDSRKLQPCPHSAPGC